jgi:CDP-glucose 4,6-dehydratase
MIFLNKFFKKKKIIITGHTGFKGSWLAAWLNLLGAQIVGISNGYTTSPSHCKILKLKNVHNKKIDIRNINSVKKIFKKYQPDFVFHLAAQSIVNKSYDQPVDTWSTNTIGTINVLESLKEVKKKCIAVIITSDKVYENLEVDRGYHEKDRLGGKDPYSASKASADIAIKSYVDSFFNSKKNKVFIATARAGNVIGGGDWAVNRLIPDCIRSWSKKNKVTIRNPNSTRPWQHVLEAVYGYILLAINLYKNKALHGEAFNFGPPNNQNYKVITLVKLMRDNWKNVFWKVAISKKKNYKESKLLKLNSKKANIKLNWKSVLKFKETVFFVSDWYKNFYADPKTTQQMTINQIKKYQKIINSRL